MKVRDLLGPLGLLAVAGAIGQTQYFEPGRRNRIRRAKDMGKYRKYRNRRNAMAKASRKGNR